MNEMLDSREIEISNSIATSERSPLAGTRILIVEDDQENVMLLRAYLASRLPSLDFAANGLEALEKRRQSEHDLILMDMQMPLMDGYTATREIRKWEKTTGARRAPIVAVTAHSLNGAHGNSIEAGCDGHLTKPVARGVLFAAIAEFAKPVNHEQSCPTAVALSARARMADATREAIPESIKSRRPAFLANRARDLEGLQSALTVLDFPAIRIIAHNCKGIGTGYGFPEFSRIGAEMSIAAKALDVDQLRECFGEFAGCLSAATS
jgi:CheY-like chemotaxis protein